MLRGQGPRRICQSHVCGDVDDEEDDEEDDAEEDEEG